MAEAPFRPARGKGAPASRERWRLVDRTNTNSGEEIVCCLIDTQQIKRL